MSVENAEDNRGKEFVAVFDHEIKAIETRRRRAGSDDGHLRDPKSNLVGLALSGGGIRSATFCLGMLQGLREIKLLHIFDYLSTVSGGGYVGGWWSAWLSRNRVDLRRDGRFPLFNVNEINNPSRLAVTLLAASNNLSEYIFAKTDNETKGLLNEYFLKDGATPCVPTDDLPPDLVKRITHSINSLVLDADGRSDREILFIMVNDPHDDYRLRKRLLDDLELMEYIERHFQLETDTVLNQSGYDISYEHVKGEVTPEERVRKYERELITLAKKVREEKQVVDDRELCWVNRALLETAYPGDIGRDIFPPKEKTELERMLDNGSNWTAPDTTSDRARSRLEGKSPDTQSAGRDPIHHLRLYANYLTPRKGILSGDTWRVVTVVTRNLAITWSILLPALVALVLAGQLYFVVQPDPVGTFIHPTPKNTLHESDYLTYKSLEALLLIEKQENENLNRVDLKDISKKLNLDDQELRHLGEYIRKRKDPPLDNLEKALKGVDDRTLEEITDRKMEDFSRSKDLQMQIAIAGKRHIDLMESARETAMKTRLGYASLALAPLVAWILLLGLVHLVLTIEPEVGKRKESIVIWLSLFVVLVAVGCVASAYVASQRNPSNALGEENGMMGGEAIGEHFSSPANWKLIALEFLVVSALVLSTTWTKTDPGLRGAAARHKRWEMWRNRISLVQAKLMVGLVLTAVVLLVSGFGHEVLNENSSKFAEDAVAQGGFVAAIIAAIVGSIFVIHWVRPKSGADRREPATRSRITRLILAVTPTLVVVVLAIGIAWVGHEALMQIHKAVKPFRVGRVARPRLEPPLTIVLLTIAAYCGIFIGFVYAIFETKELSERRIYGFVAGASATLLALCLVLHGVELVRKETPNNFWLICAELSAVLLSLALIRGQWKNKHGNHRTILLVAFSMAILTIYLAISFVPNIEQQHTSTTYGGALIGLIVTTLTFVIGLGWMADPNAFTMHVFYKARLVRAYLGASNNGRRRSNKEITEPDANDDLLLSELKNCEKGAPYHLINTTLNLTAGRDLATAQRSAESFVLSHRYCGSMRTCYRETEDYMKGRLSLGAAIAVSGAAASPNMGLRTPTAALAMIMTMFNIRLGYWVPTPNRSNWASPRARLWPFYLFREFLSRTNDLSNYCYLTDGGHFDNTGVYALVQRGCRYILLADCGADPGFSFGNFGDVTRRCRIDFGAEINLDIRSMINGDGGGHYYKVGSITYNADYIRELRGREPSEEELTGAIVLVKPAIPEQEWLADVRQYKTENPLFPQQPTVNQWFDEAQFESYRQLGSVCAESLFKNLREKVGVTQKTDDKKRSVEGVGLIFNGVA